MQQLSSHNKIGEVYGVGGEELKRRGVRIVADHTGMMTFGLSMSGNILLENYKAYRHISRIMYQIRPRTFIAVAYPGINLLLCRYAKKLGCQVYYFLPPQIWAWGSFRTYFIKKWVTMVISVFPFEYEVYKSRNIATTYLENPLFETLKTYQRTDQQKKIGLMPGSRIGEIKRNVPIILNAVKEIKKTQLDIEFEMIVLPTHASDIHFDDKLRKHVKVVTENRYQAMKNCDMLVICSGTASLEAAMMSIHQIFFNYPSSIDYHIVRHILKLREYNLANLYFGDKRVISCVSRNKPKLIRFVVEKIAEFSDSI